MLIARGDDPYVDSVFEGIERLVHLALKRPCVLESLQVR